MRTLTTLLIGPGAFVWSTRALVKVKRMFGPSNAAPATLDAKNSGAFGSSKRVATVLVGGTVGAGVVGSSAMVQGSPLGGT